MWKYVACFGLLVCVGVSVCVCLAGSRDRDRGRDVLDVINFVCDCISALGDAATHIFADPRGAMSEAYNSVYAIYNFEPESTPKHMSWSLWYLKCAFVVSLGLIIVMSGSICFLVYRLLLVSTRLKPKTE